MRVKIGKIRTVFNRLPQHDLRLARGRSWRGCIRHRGRSRFREQALAPQIAQSGLFRFRCSFYRLAQRVSRSFVALQVHQRAANQGVTFPTFRAHLDGRFTRSGGSLGIAVELGLALLNQRIVSAGRLFRGMHGADR